MRAQLARDFERFGREWPRDFAAHVREAYRVDLRARYLGESIPHPIGKGSGQLSLNIDQLEADAAAGLAFVVLKTAIAEDESGARSMAAWAIHETRMRVEERVAASGRMGWTVTWKGRGWDRSFGEYLDFVRAARAMGTRAEAPMAEAPMLAVPSIKYHCPQADEPFRAGEFAHTTSRLAEAWGEAPLLLEVDFSPTLAGDARADERAAILRWLDEIPALVRAASPIAARIALKLMNARFDDEFQCDMVRAASGADALVVFNRLWDADAGVAFGGFDLSDRNLRVLDGLRGSPHRPLSGTGNVANGRTIVEYARRGCESVQVHTFFQVPLPTYAATAGSRTARALHALVFDPRDGLIAVLLDMEAAGVLHRRGGELRFLDLVDDHD